MSFSSDDEADEIEYAPRSFEKTERAAPKRKLPIKTKDGQIVKSAVEKRPRVVEEKPKVEAEPEDEEAEDEDASDESEEEEEESTDSGSEPEEEINEEEALLTIASLSEAILANEPNATRPVGVKTVNGVVVPPEPTAMERLLGFCRVTKVWTVRKAALLSLLAVFKDALPSQHVRELTEQERQAKMTKETRLQKSMEKALLTSYRLYLAILFDGIKKAGWEQVRRSAALDEASKAQRNKFARLCMYCLCNMMEARPNFNYYDEILKIVIPRTSSPDDKTAEICTESLGRAVEDDTSFEVALNVIRALGRLYERKKRISAAALKAVSNLKLNLDLKDEKRMDIIEKAKKERQKRRRKYGYDLAKVLEETDVTMTRNHESMQHQIEIIRQLFTLYLRILSDAAENSSLLKRPLTAEALKGSAKLVQLVNIEFIHGLVQLLTVFFARDERISNMDVALRTCETGLIAMSVLSRPELRTKTTASEEIYFTKLLLKCVGNLGESERAALHVDSIARCVTILFIQRRELDPKIVSDFCVRLINAALRVPAHFALGLLSLERKLLERYPAAKDIVLGNSKSSAEEEACGPLIPVAYAVDAVGTEVRPSWELSLLAGSHYHLAVRRFANEARLGRSKFEENLAKLISDNHPVDGEVFHPYVPHGMKKREQ